MVGILMRRSDGRDGCANQGVRGTLKFIICRLWRAAHPQGLKSGIQATTKNTGYLTEIVRVLLQCYFLSYTNHYY